MARTSVDVAVDVAVGVALGITLGVALRQVCIGLDPQARGSQAALGGSGLFLLLLQLSAFMDRLLARALRCSLLSLGLGTHSAFLAIRK